MERQALSLWTYAAAESMFLYYFIGSLALVFFITVFITKALRRKKSQVIELMENEDYKEPTVTYLVAITTSLRLGAGCPNYVKVFMQLIGDRNVSPYFTLRADKGRRPLLKRGFTDLFLVKVKESVGRIQAAKLVVSGIKGCLKWRISQIQLYNPRTDGRRDLPVAVVAAETLDDPELPNIVIKSKSCCDSCKSIILFHQWLSRIGNTVRFGAFSDIVHVLFLFTTILTLLILSLILYIAFPKPSVDTSTFSLNYTSFAIASSISALACFCICFVFEVLMRKVRSRENELNYAYYSLKERKKYRKLYHQVRYPPQEEAGKYINKFKATSDDKLEDLEDGSESKIFVLKQSVCDSNFRSSKECAFDGSGQVKSLEIPASGTKMPPYIRNLADATSVHHEHKQTGQELDRKLSLAIINSATTGLNQVVQKNVIMDEDGVDAETGEQVKRKKMELIMVQGNAAPGMTSRTSLEKHPPLRASESKYGVSVTDKMSYFFGKLFGGSREMQENREKKDQPIDFVIPRESRTKAVEKINLAKDDFVVVDKKESEESVVEIETPAWATDLAVRLRKRKPEKPKSVESSKAGENKEEKKGVKPKSGLADSKMFSEVCRRYVHNMYKDDVKVEIHPENIAIFIDELDKLWEDDVAGKGRKSDKTGTASEKRDEFVAIDMSLDKRKKDFGSKAVKDKKSGEELKSEEEASLTDVKLAIDEPETMAIGSEEGLDKLEGELVDQVIFTKLASKHVKSRQACGEIEDSIKTWARGFVQDLLVKFRSYRDSTAEGCMTFQMTWFEVMDWVHEVMFKMTTCVVYKKKHKLFQQETFQTPEIQNFLGHASAEVILLAIDGVSSYLENEGKNSLADLLLLSHTVMQGISHVTDGLVYCLEKTEKDEGDTVLSKMLGALDVESDLKYVALKFLRVCATWTFQQGSLSWPFIKRLIPTGDEDINDVRDKVSSLVLLSAVGGAEKYNEIGFVAIKLTQFIIEESQEEIWVEFQNEQLVFTDILVKLRMLELLQTKIEALRKKKRYLDGLINEHSKPKSRIEKRMEKRLEAERTVEERIEEEQEMEKQKSKIKDPWKREMAEMEYGDWVRESGILVLQLLVLCKIKLLLENRWTKQGLQLHMRAEKHLSKALLQPNVAKAKDDPEGFWFENFLHFKRAESILGRYLVISTDHLVKLIAHCPVEAALHHTTPIEQVIEDLVVKVDIGTQILTQDEDNILDEVMRLETMQEKEIDYDIEMKLSQQFSTLHVRESVEKPDTLAHVRFSNNVIETNASSLVEDYYACENDENGAVGAGGGGYEATSAERRLQGLMVEKGLVGMPGMTDEEVDMLMIDINQSAKTAGDKESSETDLVPKVKTGDKDKPTKETAKEEDLIQMLSVLKPLKTYVAYIKKEEILRGQCTLQHYLEKSQRKRQRACSLNYQRRLDSYYIIEADENNPSQTKESLFQLEHDFMRESAKPLPWVAKTVLIWVMVIVILFSFVYVGLVAGQLSTTETQEWICYYLLSLAEFGFVLDPVRALLVGCIV